MSIAAAARQAYQRELDATTPVTRESARNPDVQSAVERVTEWIPTETVGLYVALLGLLSPEGSKGRWVLFGAGIALTIGFLLLNSALIHKRAVAKWEEAENGEPRPPRIALWRQGVLLVVCVVSFAAWACALPATPFLSLWSNATTIGGVAVLVLATATPKVAEICGVNMPNA